MPSNNKKKVMRRKLTILVTLIIFSLLSIASVSAQAILGTVVDKNTNEPLIGVAVVVKGTSVGASTDITGAYMINQVPSGSVLQVSYVSYKTIESEPLTLNAGDAYNINFVMEEDNLSIQGVQVTARVNHESENVLKNERMQASYAIENIGAKEMALKGISNAAEGVKKISSITTAESGQIFVRGLGDRYSLTTLNGLPIASPNADNKLISLDLFPTSVVKNITVSKVYEATSFADYSGARIDISTKENISDDFFSVSLSTGGVFGTLGKDFYKADNVSVFSNDKMPESVKSIASSTDFTSYYQKNDIFGTSFDITKTTALPDFSITLAGGKTWKLQNSNTLSLLASANVGKSSESIYDKYDAGYNYQAVKHSEVITDEYSSTFKTTGLLNLAYNYGDGSKIAYTGFYTRSVKDTYELNDIWTSEDRDTYYTSSNSSRKIYALFNNQIIGKHKFNDKYDLNYAVSYSSTSSDEPDRRQVLYIHDTDNDVYYLNTSDQINTNRFFTELSENELIGDVNAVYNFGDKNKVKLGVAYKNKKRDYSQVKFLYYLKDIAETTVIDDIYSVGDYISYDAIQDGSISVTKNYQSRSNYYAGTDVFAPYVDADYTVGGLLINLGLRFEKAVSWVTYWNEAAKESYTELDNADLFPTLNLKYTINEAQSLRFGASRTVTRPSYYEMAPFIYEPNYGGDEIYGNADLINGYNINADLRYEYFRPKSNDMFSVTAYYKILKDPIEQVQELSGSTIRQTYKNADDGIAAGIEVEARKTFLKNFTVGFNASYMYTNVVLEDGTYTDSERMLQGASPYLVNADITYNKRFDNESSLGLALLYNLQGKRIQSVGIEGMANTMQEDYHTLNFAANYSFNSKWGLRLQIDNLLDSRNVYTQEMSSGEEIEVEYYKEGVSASIGVSCKF